MACGLHSNNYRRTLKVGLLDVDTAECVRSIELVDVNESFWDVAFRPPRAIDP